jgi:hypothetical protein
LEKCKEGKKDICDEKKEDAEGGVAEKNLERKTES